MAKTTDLGTKDLNQVPAPVLIQNQELELTTEYVMTELEFEKVSGAVLEVDVPKNKGTATVRDNSIIEYEPHTPKKTETVILKARYFKDGGYSEWTEVPVTIELTELYLLDGEKEVETIEVKEGETIEVPLHTNIKKFSKFGTADDAIVTADEDKKTITGVSLGNTTLVISGAATGGTEKTIEVPIIVVASDSVSVTPKESVDITAKKAENSKQVATSPKLFKALKSFSGQYQGKDGISYTKDVKTGDIVDLSVFSQGFQDFCINSGYVEYLGEIKK